MNVATKWIYHVSDEGVRIPEPYMSEKPDGDYAMCMIVSRQDCPIGEFPAIVTLRGEQYAFNRRMVNADSALYYKVQSPIGES